MDQDDEPVREFEITIRVSEREVEQMAQHLVISQMIAGDDVGLLLSEQIYQRIIEAVIKRKDSKEA